MADGQWWADRLGNRQAEGGSAVASWSFYSPEAESSGEMFRPWGAARLQRSSRRRRIPAPLPKEDGRVLAYRHVPPCGQGSINPAGSGAHGAADRPYPPRRPAHGAASLGGGWGGTGGWRRRTLAGGAGPRPSHRAAAAALAWGSFSPAPAAGGGGGGGGGGPRRGGMGRLAGGWGVDRRLDGRWPDRQAGRRGLDKGSDGRLPIPPVLREGHPEPAIDDWGGPERVVGRVRTAGRSEKWSRRERRERESEGGRVARWQSHPGGGTAG